MTDSASILRAARARIADPKNWTTEFEARDVSGREVNAGSRSARCWCALGSLRAECHAQRKDMDFARDLAETLREATNELFNCRLVAVANDHYGHSAVLKIYDRAIELAEAQS